MADKVRVGLLEIPPATKIICDFARVFPSSNLKKAAVMTPFQTFTFKK
jgi:hypothetical protein